MILPHIPHNRWDGLGWVGLILQRAPEPAEAERRWEADRQAKQVRSQAKQGADQGAEQGMHGKCYNTLYYRSNMRQHSAPC
jgi:hypothetical protein